MRCVAAHGASASRDSRAWRGAGDGGAARSSLTLARLDRRGLRRGRPFGAALSWEASRGFAAPPAPHRLSPPVRACARRLALLLGRCMAASVGAAVRPLRGISRRVQLGAQGRGSGRGAPRCAWPSWDCGRCPGKRHGALPLSPGAATRSSREAARGGRCKRAKIWNCQNKRSMVSLVSSYKPSVTALHKRIATVDSPQKRSPRLMHHEV